MYYFVFIRMFLISCETRIMAKIKILSCKISYQFIENLCEKNLKNVHFIPHIHSTVQYILANCLSNFFHSSKNDFIEL